MSADAKLSVPIKLLLEGINHTVTVEMKNGESYRGELAEAEECMNLQLSGVTHTAKNGQKRKLERVFVRGSNVKLIVFPNILKEATIFRKVANAKRKDDRRLASKRGRGRGRGGGGRGRGAAF
mmetsp:Transcript_5708/g.14619  ORF Transcript_5708/g.14619 Transcript_5708/m.14619 type:complete len:123 (-) Transcript_5708:111-479(-)